MGNCLPFRSKNKYSNDNPKYDQVNNEKTPLLPSMSKMNKVSKGIICAVCEKKLPNMKCLERINISSIRDLKFCDQCRITIGDTIT